MSATTPLSNLAVLPTADTWLDRAAHIGARLGIPVLDPQTPARQLDASMQLILVGAEGVQLQQAGPHAPGPVTVNFAAGSVQHRRLYGGGRGQSIAKAVGIKPGIQPYVADVTAGLGRDGFVFASLGCRVDWVERHPVIALLLEDGLERGRKVSDIAPILAQVRFFSDNGEDWLKRVSGQPQAPDVVYLDPMFPESGKKSAQVKKEMRLFRELVGNDEDAGALLEAALQTAKFRVVVKRPRLAPPIVGPEPGYRLEGKSNRFDVYPLRGLSELLQ